ncbi:MAG: hypothetical protein K2Q18_00220, partial [Bdellovibrionales bacterium]|nr:hypothetical protein [Bdellovibrionales bacterium]
EFGNMVENLVGNYCSTNISVISKRELTNNMLLKFEKENTFSLPTIDGNPFFPDNMNSYLPPKKAKEQEFLYTVKLFQALCSWSGNPSNPGLMVPILKNGPLMAFFARQMSNQEIAWNERSNTLYLKEKNDTVQVWCENLICRKVNQETLQRKFIYSIGGTSVNEDMKRLYCDDFRDNDYKPKEMDARLAKIMNTTSFDEENFINSQFIALITGVPDFLLRAEKFNDGADLMRASLDFTWNRWAKNASSSFNNDLFFEEPLLLEYIPFKQYYSKISPKLKIAFDVNLGEFDRLVERNGKLKATFKVNVSNAFLKFYRRAMYDIEYYQNNSQEERARLLNRFKLQLTKDIQSAREKFIIPPWKGDLETIVANVITSEIVETPENYLNFNNPGEYSIEVEVNYGLFALKYINHQLRVKQNQEKNLPVTPK